MRVEIPILTRCCCCLPLRRGLLFWAYFIMIANIISIIDIAKFLSILINKSNQDAHNIGLILYFSLEIFLMILDLPFTITFIVGAHRKNTAFLKKYFYYEMITSLLHFVFWIIFMIWIISKNNFTYNFINLIIVNITMLGVQVYMILLIRSEMIKLEENCEFRFNNQAAEAECTIVPQDATIEVRKGQSNGQEDTAITMSVY